MSDRALARCFCLLSVCPLLFLPPPPPPPPPAGPPVMAPTAAAAAAASWLSSPQCPAGWEKMPKWPPATTLDSPIAGLLPSIGNHRHPPGPAPPSAQARSPVAPFRLRSRVPDWDLPAPSGWELGTASICGPVSRPLLHPAPGGCA